MDSTAILLGVFSKYPATVAAIVAFVVAFVVMVNDSKLAAVIDPKLAVERVIDSKVNF